MIYEGIGGRSVYFFDKKTAYLIWDMREGQVKGVGSVKFLAMDEVCRIEAVITGCGNVEGTYSIYVCSGDIRSLLGQITLHKGKGNFYLKCNTNTLGHQALPYRQVTGVFIDLKTEGILQQKWLPMTEAIQKQDVDQTASPIEVAHKKSEEKTEEEISKNLQEQEQEMILPKKSSQKTTMTEEIKTDTKPPQTEAFALYTNKWTQLCAIYPVVHPFQDGRAYLSIEPRDFVILQERYQPMVQNSFLLHSFYHYRHLLLGRVKQGQHVQYYLGVPGVFYEKEKAAALFYGFESFEGAVTPAKEGEFGYYMKRVQI